MQTGLVPSTASLSHSLPTFLAAVVPPFKSTKSTVHSPLNGPDFIYKVYRPSTFNISIICTTNALQPRALQPTFFVNTRQSVTGLRYATLNNANGSHVEWFYILRAPVMRG